MLCKHGDDDDDDDDDTAIKKTTSHCNFPFKGVLYVFSLHFPSRIDEKANML